MTKLIPAKCPSCSASLEFPEGMEMGHCMHCGGKVIIDREVHVHGQTAIACPECNGKGFFPCNREDIIRDDRALKATPLVIKKRHEVKLVLHKKQHAGSKIYARALGCDRTGVCHKIEVHIYGNNPEMRSTSEKSSCKEGKCVACKGTGKVGFFIECGLCGGTGICLICEGTGRCTICGGTGKIKCEACDGSGFKIYRG